MTVFTERLAMQLNRRSFLRTATIGSVAAMALVKGTASASSKSGSSVSDTIITVNDGSLSMPISSVFPDIPKDKLQQFLTENGMAADVLVPECNVTVFRKGDRLAIFDVGSGPNFVPTAGKLIENLAETGIDPADVTDVIFTHAHPDHLWGLLDEFDELVFANANYHIGQAEWDFWSSSDALAAMPEDRQVFVVGAQSRFEAIQDRVTFINPGNEVIPGVEAVDTAGHTPGHLSFLIHEDSGPVFVAGDAISNSILSFAHPEWPTASDQDPELGVKTRLALLDRLANEKTQIIGYHFTQPARGIVERKDNAYRLIPT